MYCPQPVKIRTSVPKRCALRVASLFSGVGGLESTDAAELLCEMDPDCQVVLQRRFPDARIVSDVRTLRPQRGVDAVFGGWPCQDISVAGLKRGLGGDRSGLLFTMIDFARASGAATIVAENVPNLLRLEDGHNFAWTLTALQRAGYENIAWRTLNARSFGLPHERRRVFIVASEDEATAMGLLRDVGRRKVTVIDSPRASGFYWTAGLQGINFSVGYSPTLKVGSSLSIPSPPAIIYDDIVRQISPKEALRLQGFPQAPFAKLPPKAVFRMMGNAVARPVGQFATASVALSDYRVSGALETIYENTSLFQEEVTVMRWPTAGMRTREATFRFHDPLSDAPRANNLEEILDLDNESVLSRRAAAGLLKRLEASQKFCPEDLRVRLKALAEE
jgi:DNA (cytosine-5)-methyltransferase 1